ncbi:PAS domain-containing sensor histidine kinase [Pontibacter sp. HSC-36F09]|uniref:PAS domain-containing sensor histidine kinase n=1 Tax=Pontibacter sp. HSC-36F09 TaxID=2910966 RepID=UPI00209E7E0F|nr:PAS domain-containing sensor histidine kinase [Pontibacter sp. HSC-36F09]MCP2045373.1 signal transduction histidine kinase [Pontibacter sp. HSC-36F09]
MLHSNAPNQENQSDQTIPYKRLLEAQSGLVLLISPDLTIMGASEAYLREAFLIREHIMGKHLFAVFPDNPNTPGHTPSVTLRASIERAIATRKPDKMDVTRYDIQAPEESGEFIERYWASTNTPIYNSQNELVCILHETKNISDELKTKAQLQESRAKELAALAQAEQQRLRMERFFDQAPAACAMLEGPTFIYRVINSSYYQLFPGREMLNLPLFEALPELRHQPVYDIIHEVYRTGVTYEGKEVLIPVARYEGQPAEDIYWNFIYQALLDAQGNVNGILIFALDVTDFVTARQQVESSAASLQAMNLGLEGVIKRRTFEVAQAQAEAERQSKRLQDLFMGAPAAICILNGPDLVYELVNPAYAAFFPGRQLLSKPILKALPEIEGNPVYKTFRDVYATGRTHQEKEMYIPFARPDGEMEDRYFRYIQQARYNEQNQIDGVVVFALEVTEQVQARKAVEASEQQLQKANKEFDTANQQLVYINRDLDNFIYTASHDLKAPISNIEMLISELLLELSEDSLGKLEVRRILNMIQGSVSRFKKTIASLTEISRLPKEELNKQEHVVVAEVVREVELDLEKMITEYGAHIETDVADCSTMSFSEKNLRSILYNLMSNGIKYSHPDRKPQVKVSCEQVDGFQMLQVKDNGLGLRPAQQDKLFTMFKRFHDHVEGSGVGLYMVKRIVENAGGRIEVESEPDKGTTFRIYFSK